MLPSEREIPLDQQNRHLRSHSTPTPVGARPPDRKSMTKKFTMAECAKHNSPDDIWLVIEGKVYDVSSFYDEHPGGGDMLLGSTGAWR